MSSCTFPYIEKAFRNNDPSQADYLNGLHISAWKQVKESNLFDLDESGYKFNVEDVEERLKQDDFVNLLNTDFKGEVVTNQNNYVAVNLTPIFPDNNNIELGNISYNREKLGRLPNISKQLSATNDFNRALIQYVEETYLMGRPTYKKTDSGNYTILQKSDKLRNTRNPFIASLNIAKSLKKSIEKDIPGMKIEVVDSNTGYHYIKIKPSKELIQKYENIFRINSLFPDLPSTYSKDPLVRSKYFRDSDTITDKEILTKISKSNHPLANLAKHLIKYTSGIPINLVPEIPILDNREGEISGKYYNNSGNEYIEIAEFATFKGRGSEPTIIHEVLHSLTAKWLREVNKESELYKEFDKYYKETIQNVGKYIENKTAEELGRNNFYAVKDLDEFIVALFTDGQFIKTLKNIPASEPTKFANRFQELFNFLLSLFGIKQSSSLYSEAFAVASNIIEEQFELDNTLLDFTDPYRDDFFDNYDLIDSYDVSLDNYSYDPSKNISNVDVKPGVEELFDSNPELANQVYEALGFEIPTTKLQGRKLEYNELNNPILTYFDVVQELTSNERENLPSSILIKKLLNENYLPKINETDIVLGVTEGGIWRPNLKKIEAAGNNKSTLSKKIGHELLHSVTGNIILSYQNLKGDFDFTDKYTLDQIKQGYIKPVKLNKIQIEALDNLVRLRNKVIDYIEKNKKTLERKDRGFGTYDYFINTNYTESETDLHEFISEVFSNPELINILKEIPTEGKKSNLFKDFVDAIAKILGFTNTSILEDIIAYSEEAFFQQPQITPQQKQQALQQYSQYLDTIFPDSKFKDIVYRRSPRKNVKSFNKREKKEGFDQPGISSITKEYLYRIKNFGDNLYTILLDIKNPYNTSKDYDLLEKGEGAQEKGYDGIISNGGEINVYESEQIHILGNKEDIEGFKEFVNNDNKIKPLQEDFTFNLIPNSIEEQFKEAKKLENKTPENNEEFNKKILYSLILPDISYNRFLKVFSQTDQKEFDSYRQEKVNTIINNFVKKFGITVETISKYQDRYAIANNKTISYNGVANLANKTIKYLEGDTNALTEEVAHFMIAMLGSDSEQYLALKNYIKQTPEYEIYYDTYFEVYNDVDKTEEEIMGKVLANALLGKKEQVPLSLKSIIKQIFNKIKSFITPQYKREFNKAVDNITHLFFTENFDTAFNEANINFNEFYQLDLNFQQQAVFEKSSDQIIDTILTNLQRQKAKFIQNKQTDLVYKINDLIEILKDTEGDIDNSERIKNFISFSVLEIEEIKRSLKNFEESGVIQELQNKDFSKLTREQQEAYTQEQRLHTLNYISSAISTVQNLNSFITLIDENFNSFNKDLKSLFDFKELINNLDDTPANNALKEILKFTQSDTKNSKLEEIRSVYNKISQDLLTVVFNALSTEEQKSFLKNIKTNPISKSANQNDVKTVTGIFNTIKDYSLGKYSISSIYNSFRTNLMPLSFQKDIFLVSIDNANAAIRQIKLMETTAEVYEMDLLHTDLQVLGEFDQNFVSAKDEKGKPNFKLLQKYNFSKFKTSLASKILNKDLIPFINKNLDVFKKQLEPKDLQILLNSLNGKINNTKELEILLSKLFENGNLNKKLYYFLKNYIKAKELIYTLSLSKANDNLSDIDYNTLNQYQNEYIQQLQFKLDNLDFTDDNLPYLNINFDFTKASVSESDLQNVVLNIIKLRRDKIISEEVTIPEQINGVPNPVYYNQLGYAEGLLNFFKQKINFSEDSSGNVNLNYINFLTLGDDLFFNLTDTNNIEGIDYIDQDYLKLENDAKNSSNTRTQKLAETKLKIIKKIQDYNDKHNLKSNYLKKKLKYNNSQYLSNNSNYRGFLNLLFRRVLPAAITLGVYSNIAYAPVIYYASIIGIDQLVKIAYFVRSNGYNWDSVKKAIRLYFNSNYKDELRVDETTLNNSDSEQVKLTNIFSKLFEAVKNKINKKQLNNVDTDSEVIDTNTFLVGEAELPKPFSDPGLDNTQLSYDFISDFKTFTQEMANYETNVRWESWIRMVGDYMSKRDDTSGISVINTIKDRYFFNKFYSPDKSTIAVRLITGWFALKALTGNIRSQIINFTVGSFTSLIHSDPITFTKAFISTLKDSSIRLNTAIDGKTILNDFINMFTGSNSEKSRLAFFQTLADVFILGKNPSLINQRNNLNSHIKRYLKTQRGTGFTVFDESEDYLTSLTQSTGNQGLQQLVENFITSNLINIYLLNNPLYTENNEPILNLKNYLYIENGKIKLDTKKLGKEKIYLKDAKKSQELNFENVDIAQNFSNLTFEQLGVKPLTAFELENFLNETMLNEISNLQEKSQGVYNIFNKAYWRNKSIGLLLLQFKDYILPAQTTVLNSKKISSDLKDYEKGILNSLKYVLFDRGLGLNFSKKQSYDPEQNVLLLQWLDYKTIARDNAILKFLLTKVLNTNIDKSLKEIASDNKKYRESVKKQTSFNILSGISRIEYIQLFSNKPDSEIYKNIQKTFLTQDSKKIQLIKKLIDTKFKTSPPSSFDESDLKDLEDLDVKENYAEVIKSYTLLENELSGDIKALNRLTNMVVTFGGLYLIGLLLLLLKGLDDEDEEEKGTKGYTIWDIIGETLDYFSVERENIVSNLVANFAPYLELEAFGLKNNKWDYTKGLLAIGDYTRIISNLDLNWASDDNVRTSTKKIKEREFIAKLTKGNLPLFKPLIKRDKNGNYYLENNIDLKENILKLIIPKGIADNFELFENKRDKEKYEQMKNLNFIQLLTLMAKNNKFAKFGGIYINPEEQEKRDKQLEASNERIEKYKQDQEEEEEEEEEENSEE